MRKKEAGIGSCSDQIRTAATGEDATVSTSLQGSCALVLCTTATELYQPIQTSRYQGRHHAE